MSEFDNNSSLADLDDFIPDYTSQPEETETVEVDTEVSNSEQPEDVAVPNEEAPVEVQDKPSQEEPEPITLTKAEYDDLVKSKEQIEKSYAHLRPKLTQVTQELSELKKAGKAPVGEGVDLIPTAPANITAADITPAVPVQSPRSTRNYDTRNALASTVQKYVDAQLQPIQQQLKDTQSETTIATKLMSLERANQEEFDAVSPEMSVYLAETPELWSLGEEKAIEIAYAAASAKVLREGLEGAVNDGVKSRQDNKKYKNLLPKDKEHSGSQASKSKAEEIADSITSMALGNTNIGSAFR